MVHKGGIMEFSERLFNLLKLKGISNAELARATGISTARLSNFYNGVNLPSLDNALNLVNYFDCTFDYLFCLNDNYKLALEKRVYNVAQFISRVQVLLSANCISQRALCKNIGVDKSCFVNWKNGTKPSISTLIKIAKHFRCSLDYLLGY